MQKFTEIGQFRQVIREVKTNYDYRGEDKDGSPIYVHDQIYPTLTFRGTVKLHGCLDENTLILLANGEEIKISEIKIGTYVLSYNLEKKSVEVNKVLNVMNEVGEKEWCELVFDSTSIICTKDHKIWTKNRGYVEAANLLSDDVFICI